MTGTEKIPLLVIGKSKNLVKGTTAPLDYTANSKAWMTGAIFEDWLRKWDKKLKKGNRKVLLYVDNCSAHLANLELECITLKFFPPNTTSMSQPIDQGIIRNLKVDYRRFLLRERIKAIDENKDILVNLLGSLHLLRKAWSEVKPETIANCLSSTQWINDHENFYFSNLQETAKLLTEGRKRELKIRFDLMEKSSVKAWSEQDDSETSPSDVIPSEQSEGVINLESDPLKNDSISYDEMDAEDEEEKKVLQGRMTCWLLFASFAASLSSLQYGYHLGVVNSPGPIMKKWYESSFFRLHGVHISHTMNDVLWAVSVSIYAFGAIFGGLVTGWLADNIGRKKTLLLNNILVVVSTALTTSAKYVDVLYLIIIGRFIIGFNCGINSNLVPLYLTEIAPINYRGTVGTLHQLAIVFSIGASLVMGLPYIFGNELLWPMLFVTALVPAVMQLLSLSFCPESPKFTIVMKGNDEQAEKDLRRLRGKDDVSKELTKIKEEAAIANAQPKVSYRDMFRAKYRRPLAIALILVISRQLAGINAISFYSTFIFGQAGLKGEHPALASAGLGVLMVLVTIFSAFMVDCKCCGRRPLLLSGLAGCCLSLGLLTVSMSFGNKDAENSTAVETWAGYCSVAFVVLFIIMWSWGIGPVPWFYVTELFHYNARGKASSLASMSNWSSTFLIGLSYPPLNDWLSQYTFLIYAGISAATFVFTLLAVPETKGKTTDEILHEIKSK